MSQCSIETLRFFEEIQQEKYIMQFLMGLKDQFNSLSNQLLLLDPFLSVALVLQKKKRREIAFNSTIPNVESFDALTAKLMKTNTFTSKQTNFHKEKPLCSRCRYTGHTS